ncbi:MAG: HEAT repeat domain-containing protein [Desulfatibacillum sp.]|nr:HEAT repeat domain-containing protein [Desulfatibacillum sp.]
MVSSLEQNGIKSPWYLSLPSALLAGMAVCHVVATFWILSSNKELYSVLQVLQIQNFLTVPNQVTQHLLLSFKIAFLSATFFTLTLGTGVSLVFMAVGLLCARIHKLWLGILLFGFFMAWFLAFVNLQGFTPYATAFFIAIPPVSGGIMWRRSLLMRRQTDMGWKPKLFFLIPVVVLGLLWSFQTSETPFVDLRDTLLLSNKPGVAVNNFYYRYTLYAARTFKPLAKRSMQTVHLEGNTHSPRNLSLKRSLLRDHYLPVEDSAMADVKIGFDKDQIVLTGWHREQLRISFAEFKSSPGKYLDQLSSQCDRLDYFRAMVFDSLMYGLPMAIYTFLFSLMSGIASRRFGSSKGAGLTAIIWMVIGITLYAQLAFLANRGHNGQSAEELLHSSSDRERLSGLRLAVNGGLDIRQDPVYQSLLNSPRMIEKYWLAKTLAANQDPEGFKDLLRLLNDPSPNVQCQALWALGRRPQNRPEEYIRELARTSDHIYVQLYAFNALKRLGWRQSG